MAPLEPNRQQNTSHRTRRQTVYIFGPFFGPHQTNSKGAVWRCPHFFIKFRNHPNLLNCNKHVVKTLLLPLQASHFGIANLLQIHVFSRHALGPIFSLFNFDLCQKLLFWDPLSWRQWQPKTHILHPIAPEILCSPALGYILGTDWCCRSPQSALGVHFE